jgi:hypothetical protein
MGRQILKLKRMKWVKSLKKYLFSKSNKAYTLLTCESPELKQKIKSDILKTENLLDIELNSWY